MALFKGNFGEEIYFKLLFGAFLMPLRMAMILMMMIIIVIRPPLLLILTTNQSLELTVYPIVFSLSLTGY